MTAAEVRGVVIAFERIRGLLREPLPEEAAARFTGYLRWTEERCQAVTGTSKPSRWAREIVGPVLAAGLGAAAYPREVSQPGGFLRIFGMIGEHPLTSQAAWKLMQPYVWEPVLSERALAEIRRRSELRLNKLIVDPSPVDVLEQLTRPYSGGFSMQMAHWLGDYFREHADAGTPYAEIYRKALADLTVYSSRGEMAHLTGSGAVHGKFTRDEWAELVHGRIPQSLLEVRAGFLTTRQFLIDFWEQWHQARPRAECRVVCQVLSRTIVKEALNGGL